MFAGQRKRRGEQDCQKHLARERSSRREHADGGQEGVFDCGTREPPKSLEYNRDNDGF